MIGYLSGVVRDYDLVDVHGVGYQVATPQPLRAGERAELWVHTVVREDALDLYGFASRPERELFYLLTRVTGVGPKLALGILRDLGPGPCVTALAGGDARALAKASGVGPKKAQQIVTAVTVPAGLLEAVGGDAPGGGQDDDLLGALAGLGYAEQQARDAVADVRAVHGDDLPDDKLLRLALATLAA